MKAKVTRGCSVRGLLRYAFDVGPHATGSKQAELVGGNMIGRDIRDLEQEFGIVYRLRPDIDKPVWHCSLSLPRGERLCKDTWDKVVADFLSHLEFDLRLTRYVAVRHQDTKYDHVHVIVSRVGLDAKIWHGKWEARRVIEATQAIEVLHGLVTTKGLETRAGRRRLSSGELKMGERTGEGTVRSRLQGFVDRAAEGNPTACQFADKMRSLGVEVRINFTKDREINGFSYQLNGICFQSCRLGTNYSWRGLKARGVIYERERDYPGLRKYGQQTEQPAVHDDTRHEVTFGSHVPASISGGDQNRGRDKAIEGVRNRFNSSSKSGSASMRSVRSSGEGAIFPARRGNSASVADNSEFGIEGAAASGRIEQDKLDHGRADEIGSGCRNEIEGALHPGRFVDDYQPNSEFAGYTNGDSTDSEVAEYSIESTRSAKQDMDTVQESMDFPEEKSSGFFNSKSGDNGSFSVDCNDSWADIFERVKDTVPKYSSGAAAGKKHILGQKPITDKGNLSSASLSRTLPNLASDTLNLTDKNLTSLGLLPPEKEKKSVDVVSDNTRDIEEIEPVQDKPVSFGPGMG